MLGDGGNAETMLGHREETANIRPPSKGRKHTVIIMRCGLDNRPATRRKNETGINFPCRG